MSDKSNVVLGKDVKIGKIYKTVARGTVVKVVKIEKKEDKNDVYAIVYPKFNPVLVLPDMRLELVEDEKKYDFSAAAEVVVEAKEEKSEKKEIEEKKVEKVEKKEVEEKKVEKKEVEEKKEIKEEKVEEPKAEKKEKKEKKDKEPKDKELKERKSKIDHKEIAALYDGVKSHLEKTDGTKINKNYIVFKIDDVKCRLFKYDCMVIAEKKVKDVEPFKKFEDYVKYKISDLFKAIGYKG